MIIFFIMRECVIRTLASHTLGFRHRHSIHYAMGTQTPASVKKRYLNTSFPYLCSCRTKSSISFTPADSDVNVNFQSNNYITTTTTTSSSSSSTLERQAIVGFGTATGNLPLCMIT